MAAKRRSPYLTQAQALAAVKYSPEEAALATLLKQAHDTFHQTVAAARGSGAYTVDTINRARPELQAVYNVPGLNPSQAAAPALPPAGKLDFNSASQFETQAAAHRINQSRTDALAGLTTQKAAAASGVLFGTQQARQQYLKDLGTIDNRLVQLSGEKGAYIAGQFGTLEQQAAQRALTRRGQNITRGNARLSHQDRVASQQETQRHHQVQETQAARRARRQAAKDRNKSPYSQSQRTTAARTYRGGLTLLQGAGVPKSSASDAAHVLLNGLKSKDGKTTLIPKATSDPVLANIIAERYVQGYLTPSTWKKLLRQYGIKGKRGSATPPEVGVGTVVSGAAPVG